MKIRIENLTKEEVNKILKAKKRSCPESMTLVHLQVGDLLIENLRIRHIIHEHQCLDRVELMENIELDVERIKLNAKKGNADRESI